MTRIRVLHRGDGVNPLVVDSCELANYFETTRKGKIDSSAEALRVSHNPFTLSLRKSKLCNNAA